MLPTFALRTWTGGMRLLLLGVTLAAFKCTMLASEPLKIYGLQSGNQTLVFSFGTESNATYGVQFTKSWAVPVWTNLLTIIGTGRPETVTMALGLSAQGFYRVEIKSKSTGQISADELKSIAKGIYDQIEAGKPFPGSDIALIFSAFQIPTIATTNTAALQKQFDSNLPFLMDFQADDIAAKLNGRFFITLDSLLKVMTAKNVTASDPPGELTRNYLGSKLAPLLTKTVYEANEFLPGLVLALGSERASRAGLTISDPVWGDGLLDSLQFGLLLQSLSYKPSSSLTQSASAAVPHRSIAASGAGGVPPWVEPVIHMGEEAAHTTITELVTSMVSEFIRFPLGYVDGWKPILCGSILLYSYKVNVQADPNDFLSACPLPDRSRLTATVSFDFQLAENIIAQLLFVVATCEVPIHGLQQGKEVEWSITDRLPEHGMLEDETTVTDADGQAHNSYVVTDTPVPKELRSVETLKVASGSVDAKILDLFPDEWANLEVIVRAGRPKLGKDSTFLYVQYWDLPKQMSLGMSSHINAVGMDVTADIVLSVTVPLHLEQEIDRVSGRTNFVYLGHGVEKYDSFKPEGRGATEGCTITPGQSIGDTMYVRIPVGPCDSDEVIVLVDPGAPIEHGTLSCPDPDGEPFVSPWIGVLWASGFEVNHAADVKAVSGITYYKIKDWQPGASAGSFSRDYHQTKSVGNASFTEDTKFTLQISP